MRCSLIMAVLVGAGHVRRDDGPGLVSVLVDGTALVRRARRGQNSQGVLLEGTATPDEDALEPAGQTTQSPAPDGTREDAALDNVTTTQAPVAQRGRHGHHRPSRRPVVAEVCALGNFSDWFPCSAPCGGGEQTREKLVLVEGRSCPDNRTETRECNPHACNGTTTVDVAVVRVHLAYLGTPTFAPTIRRAVAGFLGAAPSRVSIVSTQDVVEAHLPPPQHEMAAVVLEVMAHSENATARQVWGEQAVELLRLGRVRPVVFAKAVRSQIDVDHEGDVEFRADRDVGVMMVSDPQAMARTVLKSSLPDLSSLTISEIGMEEPHGKRQELEEVEAVEASIPSGFPASVVFVIFTLVAVVAGIGAVTLALHLRRKQQLQFVAHGDLITYKVTGEDGPVLQTKTVVDVLTDHTTGEVTKFAVEENGKTRWLEQDEVTAVVTDSEDDSSDTEDEFDITPLSQPQASCSPREDVVAASGPAMQQPRAEGRDEASVPPSL